VQEALLTIQSDMLARATAFRDANTHWAGSYDEFKEVLESKGGFLRAYWDGSSEDEDRIKEETKATIRCFPFDAPDEEGICFYTGRRTRQVAVFARAY
jgi:prolyl-tRNA synthetase